LLPVKTTIDKAGRIVVPKALREAVGLTPGTTVDISEYGDGLHLAVGGRTGRLVEEDGLLVATGETRIDDEIMFRLIDAGRR
ncbi:MAG: AbrB/MazE/SpoVT family DNA-binding domain-containing protein, partial [Solirubrobacterales bacterium]